MGTSELTDAEKALNDNVLNQYSRAPFPPVRLFPVDIGMSGATSWMYSFSEAYYHATRVWRRPEGVRLLDAGCGTGHGVAQIRHFAPGAEVHACDFSRASLELARKRVEALNEGDVIFHEMNLLDLSDLPGEFDLIFCSGVVHHTANPVKALAQLRSKLKPDGVLYLMLYSRFGRQPTIWMQRAIKLLNGQSSDQAAGLHIGRLLFDLLPPTNPIARWESEKWNNNHRKYDEAFIDMYVNANEKNYSINEVFSDLASAGLRFMRFANPQVWSLPERINIPTDLMNKYACLSRLHQYEVVENLFPDQDQYYFYSTHEDREQHSPAWATSMDFRDLGDNFTAIRSKFARKIGEDDSTPPFSLWSGYYGRTVKLNHAATQLLEECDGKRPIYEIIDTWEKIHDTPGLGARLIYSLENNGVIHIANLEGV